MGFKYTFAAICFLAAAAAIASAYAIKQTDHANRHVDSGLAGSWRSLGKIEGHEFQLLFTFDENGRFYRRYIVEDSGSFEKGLDTFEIKAGKGLTAGQWKYALKGTESLELAAAGEPTLLQRVLVSEQRKRVEFKREGSSDPLDVFVGKWKASFPAIGANWGWTIEIGSGRTYHSHLQADDDGTITAAAGMWEIKLHKDTNPVYGSYRVLSSTALELNIWPFGNITLIREL